MLNIEVDVVKKEMKLVGILTLNNAKAVAAQGCAILEKNDIHYIDLNRLQSHTSVTLAVFLSWQRLAQGFHKKIKFSGLSEKMIELASISGLTTLLFIQES